MTSRIPEPADAFEEEGLASPDPEWGGKVATGDPQEGMAVPADRPVYSDEYGTTAAEEAAGEPLDLRLSREEPDFPELAERPVNERDDADQPFPVNDDIRAGRIVESDEGAREDTEPDAVAHDVGTDGGGFSAEEQAMHVEPEPGA